MMKHIFRTAAGFSLCILAGGAALSCTDKEEIDMTSSVDINVVAELGGLVIGEGGETVELAWGTDDCVGVWACADGTSGVANSSLALTEQLEGSSSARFSGTVVSGNPNVQNTVFAVYPYRKYMGGDVNRVSVKIPATQVQKNYPVKENGLFVGRAETCSLNEEDINIQMTNLCAAVNLKIDAQNTEIADKKIDRLSITFEDPCVGNMIYNLNTGEVVESCAGKTVTLVFEDKPALTSVVNGWIFLKPMDYADKNVAVSLRTDDDWILNLKGKITCNMESGAAEEFTLDLKTAIDAGIVEINEPTIDLSASETANCYIVSTPFRYKFKATKGNTKDALEGVAKVDWLWASKEDLVYDISYKDGDVIFRSKEGKGNVLLAAFDADGKILWSWHIWLTDNPCKNLHYVADAKILIMDRNLGAVSADADNQDSYGLLYQWGRKDPFIGAAAPGNSTDGYREGAAFTKGSSADYVSNSAYGKKFEIVANNTVPVVAETFEVPFTIENPMSYINYAAIKDESAAGTWFASKGQTDFHLDLWGGKDLATSRKTMTLVLRDIKCH